ncbi:MAG: hypothetical protein AB1742_00545 [bacterium]
MMKYLPLLVLSVFLFAQTDKAESKDKKLGAAGMVVKIYCELDGLGAKLATDTWKFIRVLFDWEDEPGWDFMYIIDRYEIVSERYKGDRAFVRVRYHLVGILEGNDPFKKQNKIENVTYELKYTRDGWKITDEHTKTSYPPHVFLKLYEEDISRR